MDHDNPFIEPGNPTGAWNLPFEPISQPDVEVEALVVDSINVTAATLPTPLGTLPVLLLDFHNSATPGTVPRLMFVSTPETLANVIALITHAAGAAVKAAG